MDWSRKLAAALSRPQGFDWDATKRLADFQTMADSAPVGAVGAPGGLSPYAAPADPFSAQDALAALSFAPVFGDVAGLAGDAAMYATDPSSRTPGNYAMTAAGALPFVPSAKAAMLAKALAAKAGGLSGVVGMAGKALDSLPMDDAYKIAHRPMTAEGGASYLHDLASSFGEDVYGPNALQYFGSGDPRESAVLRILKVLRGNPEAEVSIYRGLPADAPTAINRGDWVTLDKRVAEDYGPNVAHMKVKARHVTSWPDSLLEFGYYPD